VRVEVLFVPGCPNYEPALERLKQVLVSEGLDVEVHGVAVNTHQDASAMMFPGSPTIRIDGEDVEPDQTNAPALTCRLYANRTGVPSEKTLRVAVSKAKDGM
jgi:hypothetical protein